MGNAGITLKEVNYYALLYKHFCSPALHIKDVMRKLLFFISIFFSSALEASFYEAWKKQFEDPTEDFFDQYPDAPKKEDRQKLLEKLKSPSKKWCARHDPLTYEGVVKCFEKTKNIEQLRRMWRTLLSLSSFEQKEIMNKWGHHLRPVDHHHRINHLLYNEIDPSSLPADQTYHAIKMARIQCREGILSSAQKLSHTRDGGLFYNLILGYKKKKMHEEAILCLKENLDDERYTEQWLSLRLFYGRYLMERGRYTEACDVLDSSFKASEKDSYFYLAFLKGLSFFLAGDKDNAHDTWNGLYTHVRKRAFKAQTAYWLSRCKDRQEWLEEASQYRYLFYGEIARILLNRHDYSSHDQASLQRTPWVQRLLTLPQAAPRAHILAFLEKAAEEVRTNETANALVRRMQDHFGDFFGVFSAIRLARYHEISQGYPLLENSLLKRALHPLSLYTKDFQVLLHALVRRESLFDAKIKSHAGAIGLTQLLESTAKIEAKSIAQRYRLSVPVRLTSPYHNVTLGAYHIQRLLDLYDGHVVLALAAYNAGKHRVKDWLIQRPFKEDILLWIEMIPFSETREYVKRILENTIRYKQIFKLERSLETMMRKDMRLFCKSNHTPLT